MATSANDDETVAQIGDQTYTSLKEAFEYANANGGTIKLLADVDVSIADTYLDTTACSVETENSITLDLNGFVLKNTLPYKGYMSGGLPVIHIKKGELILKDSDPEKENRLTDDITVKGGAITGGTGYFRNALSGYCGGGVYIADGCSFIMDGGNITGNLVNNDMYYESSSFASQPYDHRGGGVFVGEKSTFTMNGGNITYNSVVYDGEKLTTTNSIYYSGGGVFVDGDGTFTMNGGNISHNSANVGGGVVVGNRRYGSSSTDFEHNGKFTMLGGNLSSNTSLYRGGGIYCSRAATVELTDAEITRNVANDSGGAIYVMYGTVTASDSNISNNEAAEGGGVYVSAGSLSMSNSDINGNTVTGRGGAIYASAATELKIVGGNISRNSAGGNGGAINVYNTEAAAVDGSIISYNETDGRGGGIYVESSSGQSSPTYLTLNNAVISGNTAKGIGGGIYGNGDSSQKCYVVLDGECKVTENRGDGAENSVYCGGIYADNFCSLSISGKPYIYENTGGNDDRSDAVAYRSNAFIEAGKLDTGTVIGVTPGTAVTSSITTSYDSSNGDPAQYFKASNSDCNYAIVLYRSTTTSEFNVYWAKYVYKITVNDAQLGNINITSDYNGNYTDSVGMCVTATNQSVAVSGDQLSLRQSSGTIWTTVTATPAAGAKFDKWTYENGTDLPNTISGPLSSASYKNGIINTIVANFRSPYDVTDVTLDSVIGAYTAGDTSVKVNIRRTLTDTETNAISYDTVEYTAAVSALHAGNQNISFDYVYGTFSKQLSADIINVAKKQATVTWYYKNTLTAGSAQKDYDGIGNRGDVEARYTNINGTTVTVGGSNAAMNMVYSGAATSDLANLKNAGVYVFSLAAANPDDYEFSNNSFTFTVNKVGIDLSDENLYKWTLKDYGSELRTGTVYIYTVNGNAQYYYSEQPELTLDRAINVTRSIVRYRNIPLTIVLNNGEIPQLPDNGGARTSIRYDNCDQKDIGFYTSYAYLALNDFVNYYYVSGDIVQSRGMTIEIGNDGRTATITKNWYIVNISNGLMSQNGATYGQEYAISGWTYGDNVSVYAPRLEHGDEGAYNGTYNFTQSDNKVLFELYRRDVGSSGEYIKIGEQFNRYAFADYVNKTMPSGEYRLNVTVAAVTLESSDHVHWWNGERETGSKLYFEAFTREFTFTVGKAALGANVDDGLLGNTYTYEYDGELHLFKDDNITIDIAVGARTGVWAADGYDEYYDGGDPILAYNLKRWGNNNYRTEQELKEFTEDNSIRPVGVGEYTVYYRVELKNYAAYGGDESYAFTVVIEQAQFDLDSITFLDGIFVYDGNTHAIYVTGAPSFIKVEYIGNDKTDAGSYTVTAKFGSDDDAYILTGETELTATLTILAKTLEVIKDADSGEVWVSADNENGFDPGVELSIEELHDYENPNIDDSIEAAFEISLKNGDQSAAVSGKIAIRLLVPENLRGESYIILHVKSDSIESVSFTESSDGVYAIFTVDSLSPFVFVKSAAVDDPATDPVDPSAPSTPNASAADNSGNSMWWVWILVAVIIVLLIILILILIFKRKRDVSDEDKDEEPSADRAGVEEKSEGVVNVNVTQSDAAVAASKIAEAAAIVAEAAAKVAAARVVSPQEESVAAAQPSAPQPEPTIVTPPVSEADDEDTPEVDDDDVEIPSSDDFAGAFEASESVTYGYSQSVLSKLLSSTDAVKTRYSELKNYLLAYKKARANMSRARESYYIGRKCYARIAVRGKTLCLYLALDPKKYVGTKYNAEDVTAVKSYSDTPCLLRLKSERSLKYAKELIDELMPTVDAVKYDRKSENYVELFKSIEMLQKKKLISCNGNKKKL